MTNCEYLRRGGVTRNKMYNCALNGVFELGLVSSNANPSPKGGMLVTWVREIGFVVRLKRAHGGFGVDVSGFTRNGTV